MIDRLLRALARVQAWVWVAILLAGVLAGLAVLTVPRPIGGAISIENVAVALVPSDTVAAKNVALPHVWDDEKPPWHGDARYQAAWPAGLGTHAQEPLALYFPRIGARFRVWLNDVLVEDGYWDTPGYVDTSVVPQLVDLPAALVRPLAQDNRLVIEVRGQLLRKSGLSAFSIGPRDVHGHPLFAKLSVHDGSKVKIAPVHPDFHRSSRHCP